jgi:uncharacterized ferritin-like protein (DUF455 family)
MNINEFAEQIVFGKSLEDKLFVPGKLSFKQQPARAIETLRSPGRISDLRMRHESGVGTQPPSDSQLEGEKARGQLLHFLANHELLATELMALVLLKFPDAPRAFRQGVLVTLQEEQEHTRMYLRRMEECGVSFGEYPLSGQFWRVVEPMRSPKDFVSRLSLTFEQANLDYSLHFASVFRRIGDTATADVLQKIYEDEIGHVQHGLHWFRQWKNPEQSDWEAYAESLEYPMSPQRGRGPKCEFNRDGRMRAGLSKDFIDAIEVFRMSRGRAPVVRWFDPGVEVELAQSDTPSTQRMLGQLGCDLELLLAVASKPDDVVLVRQLPSQQLKKSLIDAGFDLPEFVLIQDRNQLKQRKLHQFNPWAWSPKNLELVNSLNSVVRHPAPLWRPAQTELFRKSFSTKLLGSCLNDANDWISTPDVVGFVVNSFDEVVTALADFKSRGFESAIFKSDLAASGRGQRRLSCVRPLEENDLQWLASALATNRPKEAGDHPLGIVEPELERLLDLSFLWHLPAPNELHFLGWTRPLVAPGRRYQGTRLRTPFSDGSENVKKFLLTDRCAKLKEVRDWLEVHLLPELKSREFQGFFGVDAFVYKDRSEKLAIKPLGELNPRMTMGHIALQMEKKVAQGVPALFRIFSRGEWNQHHKQLEQFSLIKSNGGYIRTGVVRFSEFNEFSKLVPTLLVGKELVNVF